MEFCLVRSQTRTLEILYTEDAKHISRIARAAVNIGPKYDYYTCPDYDPRNDCVYGDYDNMLEKSLEKYSGRKRRCYDPQEEQKLFVDIVVLAKADELKGRLLIRNLDSDKNCLSGLAAICGGFENFTLDYTVNIFSGGDDPIKFADVGKVKLMEENSANPMVGIEIPFKFKESQKRKWLEGVPFHCFTKIILKVTDEGLDKIHLNNLEDGYGLLRKFLKNTDSTQPDDATIVAENGAEIKCHKDFLSGHSPVFKAMFETSMKEGITNRLEIPDMTEACARALIDFLKCWEITEISKSPSLAMELFWAADRYHIPRMEESIRNLMLGKDSTWFTTQVTLELFQLANNKMNLENNEDYMFVRGKAVQMLRANKELDKSPEYKELFLKSPQSAMELCSYFITNPEFDI